MQTNRFSSGPSGSGRIKKESAVDKLCEIMQEEILNGVWRTGDKLPTEFELAEQYGLNRMTVRSALQRLNTLGILETRVGDGTYVREFDFSNLIAQVSDFIETPELMASIGEFRQIVEGGCARLIIDRATPEEIEELRSICAEFSALQDARFGEGKPFSAADTNRFYQCIFRFHEQLFRMTHNPLLYYAHAVSRDAVCKAIVAVGEKRTEYYRTLQEPGSVKMHEEILKTIEEKDYEACRKAIVKFVGQEVESL